MSRRPKPVPITLFDLEKFARDLLKRQRNYAVTNAKLSRTLGITKKALLDAQDAKPVPALETLLLCQWVRVHPYRYLRSPGPTP